MKHQLARTLSIGAAFATAGVVGGNAIISRGSPAAASATSSSASTPGSGSTDSSSAGTNPGSAPASTPASTVPLTPTLVAGSATQFSLVAGESATIILDTNGGVLRIVAFAPHPGWFTVRLEQPSATDLIGQLETGTSQVTFTARLDAGTISAEMVIGGVTSSVPGSSSPDGSAPGTSPDGSSSTSSPGNTEPDDDDGGGNSGPGGGGGDDSGGGSGSG